MHLGKKRKKGRQTGVIQNTHSLTERRMYRQTNIKTEGHKVRREDTERAAGTHVST